MSDYTTNTTVNLQVNGQQAAETLANLRKRAADLQNEIAKTAAAGDKVQLKKLRREFNDVNRQIKQIESSTMQAENVLRRLERATPSELNKALQTLTKQLNYIECGSAAWDAQTRKIRLLKDEIARVNEEMKKSTTWLERFNMKFQEWQTIGAGAIAALTGAVMAGKKAVQMYAEIQQEEALARIDYAKGITDYEAFTQRMLQIEVDYHQKKLAHTDLVGNEEVVIQAAYFEALKKQTDNHLNGTAEQENEAHQQQLLILQQRYVDGELTARQYQNATELAELQHLQNLVQIYAEGSKERIKAQQNYQRTALKYQERHVQEDRRLQEQLQAQFFTKSFRIADPDSYQRDLRNVQIVYNQMLQAAGENAKERQKVERAYHEAKY